jgi:hypothetical protein
MKKMLLVLGLSCVGFQTAQAGTIEFENGKIERQVLTCAPLFLNAKGEFVEGTVKSYGIVRCDDAVTDPAKCLQAKIIAQRLEFNKGRKGWFMSAKIADKCKIYDASLSDHSKDIEVDLVTECEGVATSGFRRQYVGSMAATWLGVVGLLVSGSALAYFTCCNPSYAQKYTKASMITFAASLGTLMAGYIWKCGIQYCSGLSLDCLQWKGESGQFDYSLKHRPKEVAFTLVN